MTHVHTRSPGGPRATRLVCVGVAAMVLAAGCGAADESTSSADGGGAAATSSSYFSPLQEYLSPSSTGAGADEAAQAKEKKVQEIAAACMADQGFDYVPFVYPMSTTMVLNDVDYASRAWAEKYGYGISTVDAFGTSSTAETVNDPNQPIVDAMSEGEREAYYQALYGGGMMVASSSAEAAPEVAGTDSAAPATSAGTTPEPSEAVESTDDAAVSIPEETVEAGASMVSMADQGCMGQGQAEVYGDPTADDQAQFQPMWDAYNTMYSAIDSDARMTAAKDAWIGCMADAGHPGYTDVWGANQEANDKWAEVNGWNTSDSGGAVASTSAGATSPSAPPADQVTAFKEYEIALALVDFDCKTSSDYAKVSDTVRIELEEKFLEEHRAELEQYRDVVNGGG